MHNAEHKHSIKFSMMVVLTIGLALFFIWAAFFKIDRAVRVMGQVLPYSHNQIIQSVDGGVISKIVVREGQHVIKGQTLALLESKRQDAAMTETRMQLLEFNATVDRLNAEIDGEAPQFGEKYKEIPDFVQAQRALYRQRYHDLQAQLETLHMMLNSAKEELSIQKSLFEMGDASRLDFIRSKRQVNELEAKINDVRGRYMQESKTQLIDVKEKITSATYTLKNRKDIFDKITLTSPVDGVVKHLAFNTIGGVLRAGEELMQISPVKSGITIEVKVDPVDIGQLKIGQTASVKLDTFDYSIYGKRIGKVSYISPDSFSEPNKAGQTHDFYRAQIQLDSGKYETNKKLPDELIKPGMTVTVDIKTDTRTVLHYITKPIISSLDGAMRER
jgi:adhesin transport system membrane fusion protein